MFPVKRSTRLSVWQALSLIAAGLWTLGAFAQSSRPAEELPEEVRVVLSEVEDFSFSFSQPGFYAVLEHVKTMTGSPGQARPAISIDDWAALSERPADFRGLPVTIEGIVGRNKVWRFEQEQRRHLGAVWQLELWRADQPIAATLILTDDASDIPVGATIRVTGYFVLMRQYHSGTRQTRQAALLIGHGPTLVSQTAAPVRRRSISSGIVGMVVAVTLALLVIWILLRRSAARTRRTTAAPRASGPAPVSLADDLAAWAEEEPQPPPEEGDHPDRP